MNLKQDIYTFRPHVKFVCRLPMFEICFSLFLYLIFSLKTQLAIINCFIRWPSRSSYNIIYNTTRALGSRKSISCQGCHTQFWELNMYLIIFPPPLSFNDILELEASCRKHPKIVAMLFFSTFCCIFFYQVVKYFLITEWLWCISGRSDTNR